MTLATTETAGRARATANAGANAGATDRPGGGHPFPSAQEAQMHTPSFDHDSAPLRIGSVKQCAGLVP